MIWDTVPGHLYDADCVALRVIFKGCRSLLDIGTHHGKSAVALASISSVEHVVTIDHYKGDSMIGAPNYVETTKHIQGTGLAEKIVMLDGCWYAAFQSGTLDLRNFDGVFYDAAHAPPDYYELHFLQKCYDFPGTIAVHDFKPGEKQMQHVVEACRAFEDETGRKLCEPFPGSSVAYFKAVRND